MHSPAAGMAAACVAAQLLADAQDHRTAAGQRTAANASDSGCGPNSRAASEPRERG